MASQLLLLQSGERLGLAVLASLRGGVGGRWIPRRGGVGGGVRFHSDGIAKLSLWRWYPVTVPPSWVGAPLGLQRPASPGCYRALGSRRKAMGKAGIFGAFPFGLSGGSASSYVSELFVIPFWELFISFAHFSVGVFISFLLIYGHIFLCQENERFVHDKSCKYFPPVCHGVASFCLWVFFFPLPPTMHNFYVVEGIHLFYDFLEFV